MSNDARRPLERVDLGHERRGDQPRVIEQIVIRPGRIFGRKSITYRVVLSSEQGVHQTQADPPVPAHTSRVDAPLVNWQEVVRTDAELAAVTRAQAGLNVRAAP